MEELIELAEKVIKEKLERVYEIHKIFIDTFGEENVELNPGITAEKLIGFIYTKNICDVYNLGRLLSAAVNRQLLPEETHSSLFSVVKQNNLILTEDYLKLLCSSVIGDSNIIIKWDNVIVTNEEEESVDIHNVFCRVIVNTNGTLSGSFMLKRSKFPKSQWESRYEHSHLPRIYDAGGSVFEWQSSCLGSGPINNTIATLNSEYDLNLWSLFAYELSLYITVESLEGGPYISMSEIHTSGVRWESIDSYQLMRVRYSHVSYFNYKFNAILKEVFVRRLFDYTYVNGTWVIANTPEDVVLKLSNLVIDMYNHGLILTDKTEETLLNHVFTVAYKHQGKFFRRINEESSSSDLDSSYIGRPVIKFKNKVYSLEVFDDPSEEEEEIGRSYTILRPVLVCCFLYYITLLVNMYYGKKAETKIHLL